MLFICHLTSQDHMIKGFIDFFVRGTSNYVTILPCLVAIDTSSGDTVLFICHMTLQDCVIKALCNFMVKSPSGLVTILLCLVAIGTVVVELQWLYFVVWFWKITRVMSLYGLEPMKLIYHPAKFGDHSHSVSRDIMVFDPHMTIQDHMFKALYDFMVWSPSR